MRSRTTLYFVMALSVVPVEMQPAFASPLNHAKPYEAANSSTVINLTRAREQLSETVRTLHAKWRHLPNLTKNFDESQALWRSAVQKTCNKVVSQVYAGGTIYASTADACEATATAQRAELLRQTFRSSLKN